MNVPPLVDIGPLMSASHGSPVSPARRQVSDALNEACGTWGFFRITGHGIDPALLRNLDAQARNFFARSDEEKSQVAMAKAGSAWRGWFPVGAELTSGRPDRKEGLYIGTELPSDDPRVLAQPAVAVVGTRNALDRVYVRECYNGINVHGMPYTTLTDVYVDNQRGTYGVRFYGDSTYRTDNLFLTRVVVETPYDVAGSAGFLMEGLCASVFATDCYFRDVAYGVHVRASGGNTPTFARFFRCAVEACLTNGYYLQGLSFGVVERSYIGINGLASGGGDGSGLVLGTDCSGCIQLIGNDVRGNGRHGYEIQASAAAVQIENLQHAANSQNANNTYDGVNVAGGTERFQIRGGYVGGSILMAGVATRQRYGVSIGAGCDYYIVQGVDARFNVTGAINDGGGSNKSVTGNLT